MSTLINNLSNFDLKLKELAEYFIINHQKKIQIK